MIQDKIYLYSNSQVTNEMTQKPSFSPSELYFLKRDYHHSSIFTYHLVQSPHQTAYSRSQYHRSQMSTQPVFPCLHAL